MKKLAFILSLALTVMPGWSGAISPALAETVAPAQTGQTKGTIQHKKTIRVNINPVYVSVWDDWFDPVKKLERRDGYHFGADEEKDIDKTRFYTEESSLFERETSDYKNQNRWTTIGVAEVNGKQVEVLQAYTGALGDPHYHIAYIDQATGLPIRVEDYSSTDELMTVYLYFFDYVQDETGELFKQKK